MFSTAAAPFTDGLGDDGNYTYDVLEAQVINKVFMLTLLLGLFLVTNTPGSRGKSLPAPISVAYTACGAQPLLQFVRLCWPGIV